MERKYLFTSESVSSGHPDKVSDQISDAILDAILEQDPTSKCGCEVLVTSNFVVVAGEIKTSAKIDVEKIVRNTIKEIGYTFENNNFKWDTVEIINKLHQQSPDINQGVELRSGEIGAGDQGIMFGYAVNESKNYMPLTLEISHALLIELEKLRKIGVGVASFLRPDAKSQVTIEYVGGKPSKIDTILISTQHSEDVELEDIRNYIKTVLVPNVIADYGFDKNLFVDYKLLVNPTGRFVIGGPDGDTGLTGRKIVVDQYGGRATVGGGCLSGKDSSKTDRSAVYATRWIAKNIVAAGLCDECLIQVSYAIGVPKPVSIMVNTFGTGKIADTEIEQYVIENFPLTPKWIGEKLELNKPIYKKTASYGHFGRDIFSWEKLDLVEDLKKLLK